MSERGWLRPVPAKVVSDGRLRSYGHDDYGILLTSNTRLDIVEREREKLASDSYMI